MSEPFDDDEGAAAHFARWSDPMNDARDRREAFEAWTALYDHAQFRRRTPKEKRRRWRDGARSILREDPTPHEGAPHRKLRSLAASWLTQHHPQSFSWYYPRVAGVVVFDDGETVQGPLEVSYGTSLYDFHYEYPVSGTGYPKSWIRVGTADGPPVVEWCKEHDVTILCSRCHRDITEMTEPFVCRDVSTPGERLLCALGARAAELEVIAEVSETGLLLKRGTGPTCLALWRWRLFLDGVGDLEHEVTSLGAKYRVSEVWAVSRATDGTIYRYGFRRDGESFVKVERGSPSSMGLTPFTLADQARAQAVQEREREQIRAERLARKERRAQASRRVGLGRVELEVMHDGLPIRGIATEQRDGKTRLEMTHPGDGSVWQADLELRVESSRKPEPCWREGALTHGGRTFWVSTLRRWGRSYDVVMTNVDVIARLWGEDAEAWRLETEAFGARQRWYRAQVDALMAQHQAGSLTDAGLAQGLASIRQEKPGVPPGLRRFQVFARRVEVALGVEVDSWVLARWVDRYASVGTDS